MAFIEDANPRNLYAATAGQTIFDYTYPIFDEDDLDVTQAGLALTLSDYTVQGVGLKAGGTITLNVGATLDDVIIIQRSVERKRITDYTLSGAFNADTINRELDRMAQMDQDAALERSQMLRAPSTDTNLPLNDLPDDAARALKVLAFDSFGQPEAGPDVDALIGLLGGASAGEFLGSVALLRAVLSSGILNGQATYLTGYSKAGDTGTVVTYEYDSSSVAADDGGVTIKPDDIVHPAPGRHIMQIKGVIFTAAFGAKFDGIKTDNHLPVNAAIAATPAAGGTIQNPDGPAKFTASIVIDKPIDFRQSPGTVWTPTGSFAGRGSIEVKSPQVILHASIMDGAGMTAGAGVIWGADGVNSNHGWIWPLLFRDMPESELVYEQGAYLRAHILSSNCASNNIVFTNNFDDNNHAIIVYHCSNSAGRAFVTEATITAINRSRHNLILSGKSFNCALGGALINSRNNIANIFNEQTTGAPVPSVELGVDGIGNEIHYLGDVNSLGKTLDNGSGNRITGVDANNELTTLLQQAEILKVRVAAFAGSLQTTFTANNAIKESIEDTALDTEFLHDHSGAGIRTDRFVKLKGNKANSTANDAELSDLYTGAKTMSFGTVNAHSFKKDTVTILGVDNVNKFVVMMMPTTDSPPDEVVWVAYRSAVDTMTVKVVNFTGSNVVVGNLGFSVEALRRSV